MSMALRAALRATTAFVIGASAPIMAQNSQAASEDLSTTAEVGPDQSGGGAMDEIIVTARRRAETLQDVPVTVTAYTAAQLAEKGITDFTKLTTLTPGVNFDAFPRSAPRPFFRGIGSSNQSAGGDPSSVAFLDGVYLGRGAMLGIDFFDLERVEVLKGPQGTLWGKNVVGGAVNFITAKPRQEFGVRGEVVIAEYGQLNGHAMVNVPVTDRIATRAIFGITRNDGFRKNRRTGGALDNDNMVAARAHALIEIGESSSLLLSGDINDQELEGTARFNLRPNGFRDVEKPRRANPDRQGFTNSETGGLRGELTSDVLGFATLTATGAWRTLDYAWSEDLDGTDAAGNAAAGVPASALQVLAAEQADSYSGELRLNSAGSSPLSWVAGLYYLHDDVTRARETETAVVDTSENRFVGMADTDSYAAFGELQYDLGFGLELFGGLRYTDERKTYGVTQLTGNPAAPTVGFTTVANPGEARAKKLTYRAGADYKVSDEVMIFASVSTGFKSGAFQEQPNALTARFATAPETVINYEAGIKSEWLDRRLRTNLSVFRADYDDLQTIQSIPDLTQGPAGSRIVVDTGNATIQGIESEVVLAPVDWIDLTMRHSYLDATFDSLVQTARILADGTAVRVDLAGNRLSRTPKHAISADLGVETPRADWGWLRAVVSMNYQSQLFDDNANDPIEFRRARTLWDLSLTYHLDEHFMAQAWVRNLTDVEYRTHQVETAGGLFAQYGPPRQIGLTLGATF